MIIYLVVLNHNGRKLLAECLPSVVRAAEVSRHDCRVAVIDNSSTDESIDWLAHESAGRDLQRPNEGLCSYNQVLTELPGPAAVLLNNDIRLAEGCVDPLVDPLLTPQQAGDRPIFATSPLCWLFDGQTYEGLKTGVGWRWGLVQATAHFPGYENNYQTPGLTASAGCALAVDRAKFLELGGFDPLYLPGRLEDLDFCFRGYQAGYQARLVPTAVAYHRGAASLARRSERRAANGWRCGTHFFFNRRICDIRSMWRAICSHCPFAWHSTGRERSDSQANSAGNSRGLFLVL